MKKSLVLILALALVFCFATTALASTDFSDIGDQTQDVQDAIYKLAALGMVNGYEDGTWRPGDQITRAEFAKIACLAGGFSASYDALSNVSTPFPDVKVGVWYTGWVNLAYSQGYMKGDVTGTFRPNDPISENEVITVLLRLLGYNDNLAGQWPVDYVRQAGLLGILDDVKVAGNVPATRATVAVLTDAILSENLVAWSKDSEVFEEREFSGDTRTLLVSSFSGGSASDVLVGGWGYSDWDDDTLALDYDDATLPADFADTFKISSGLNLWDMNGKYVDAIYSTSDDEMLYLDITSTELFVSDVEFVKAGKISLDGKTYPVVDEENISGYDTSYLMDLAIGADEDAADDDMEFTGGSAKAYLNSDGEVYRLDVYIDADGQVTAEDGGIIEEVDTDECYIDFYSGSEFGSPETDFDGVEVSVIKDGQLTKDLDALETGDSVSVWTSNDGNGDIEYMIYVNRTVAADTFTKKTADKYTVGGTAYWLNDEGASYTEDGEEYANLSGSDIADYLGSDIALTLNRAGCISSVSVEEAGTADTVLGVLLDYSTSGTVSTTVNQIKVFNSEGKVATYDVVDKAYNISSGDYKDLSFDYDAGSLIKFRLDSDGAIDKAINLGALGSEDSSLDADDDYNEITIGTTVYNVDSSTAIFNVTWDDGFGSDIDEVTLVTLADLLKADVSTDGCYYVEDGDNLTALVLNDFGASSTGNYGILSDWGYTTADYDYVTELADGTLYNTDSESGAQDDIEAMLANDLFSFDVDSDTITDVRALVMIDADDTTADVYEYEASALTLAGNDVVIPSGITSSRIRIDDTQYQYSSDTAVFDYSKFDAPKKLTSSAIASIDTDKKEVAVFLNDADEVVLVVIFNQSDDAVITVHPTVIP